MTRPTNRPPAVPDVAALPCPNGGLHHIVWRRGLLLCAGCGVGWGVLDAAVREGLS